MCLTIFTQLWWKENGNGNLVPVFPRMLQWAMSSVESVESVILRGDNDYDQSLQYNIEKLM